MDSSHAGVGLRWQCLVAVALVWVCFLTRGVFYCSFLPLWEGYDEWSHFAYIQRLALGHQLLVDRTEPVSQEVSASLQLAPVPWELRALPAPSVTEDTWWALPPDERARRERELARLPQSWSAQVAPAGPLIYEALQPPLYYWLLSIPYRLARDEPLTNQVFLIRCIDFLIASFCIPLVFLVARRVAENSLTAAGICALVAALPELMLDICRVGNECLGIVLFSWLTLLVLCLGAGKGSRIMALWTGVALGLGLLTKVYFLTALPALVLVFLLQYRQTARKAALLYQVAITFGSAALIAGWWYARNRITTGTWTGLTESAMLVRDGPWQYLASAIRVPWGRAIDSILLSHVWFGGWSSLGLRSWIYHFFFGVAGLASVGIVLAVRRSKPIPRVSLLTLLAIYGSFWAGQLYNVLLLFMSKGAATSMGWYMYCVVAAEATLLVVGLGAPSRGRQRGFAWGSALAIPLVVLFVAALDLYSLNFVSIPYYAGLIAHRSNGSLSAFHIAPAGAIGITEVFTRLSVNKASWLTPGAIEAGWVCDVFATALLVGLAVWIWRKQHAAVGTVRIG